MAKKKLYISAPFELQASGRILRDHLVSHGFEVTSTWLDEPPVNKPTEAEMAERDIFDILRSDAIVLINPDDWKYKGTGGRHVEVGIAIIAALPVFIYGIRSNVFHHFKNVLAVSPTVGNVVASLKDWRERS